MSSDNNPSKMDAFMDSFLEVSTEDYMKPELVVNKIEDKSEANVKDKSEANVKEVGNDDTSMDNMLEDILNNDEAELVREVKDTEVVNQDNISREDQVARLSEKPRLVQDESSPFLEIVDENSFNSDFESNDIDDYDNYYYYVDENSEKEMIAEQAQAVLDWKPPSPKSGNGTVINEWITTGWIGMLHLDYLLTKSIIKGASDLHVTADQVISMSINGDIIRYPEYIIPDEEIMHMLIHNGILSHQEQAEFNKEYEYDGSYTLQYGPYRGTRTRINVGRTFGKYFIVFRIINDYIPTLEELDVEQEIVDWSYYPNGLFMLCGPTGTGKSTTLASVISNIQQTMKKKIITIEKPVEYLYPDDAPSLVVQREVGGDTRGFYEGLTSAMRQNPDIILLGEVRNTEEVMELLRAAETGHLAISTMHTNSVATTINRIQSLFTGNEQRRIMSTLADTLRGIGNQVLVKNAQGGRFAVRELLTINQEIKDLIIKGDVQGIRNYQVAREATMEHKLVKAVKSGKCLREEAIKHAADPVFFNKLMSEKE